MKSSSCSGVGLTAGIVSRWGETVRGSVNILFTESIPSSKLLDIVCSIPERRAISASSRASGVSRPASYMLGVPTFTGCPRLSSPPLTSCTLTLPVELTASSAPAFAAGAKISGVLLLLCDSRRRRVPSSTASSAFLLKSLRCLKIAASISGKRTAVSCPRKSRCMTLLIARWKSDGDTSTGAAAAASSPKDTILSTDSPRAVCTVTSSPTLNTPEIGSILPVLTSRTFGMLTTGSSTNLSPCFRASSAFCSTRIANSSSVSAAVVPTLVTRPP